MVARRAVGTTDGPTVSMRPRQPGRPIYTRFVAEDASAFSAIEGREAELEQLGRLFDLDAPAGLVIEGEAGIGKTTVWLAGVELARGLGHECSCAVMPQPRTPG